MYDGNISPFADVRVAQAFMQLVEHAAVEAQENLSNVAHANFLNQQQGRGGPAAAPAASHMRDDYDASTSEHGACRTSSGRSMMYNQHGGAQGNMGSGVGSSGGGGTCVACSTGSSISHLAHPHQQLSAADVLRRFVAGIYDRPTSQFYSGAAASVFMADLQSLIHTVPTSMSGGAGRSLAGAAEMVLRAFPATTAPVVEGGLGASQQRPPSTAGGGKHPITSPTNTAMLSGTLTSAAQTMNATSGAGSPMGRTAADLSHTTTSQQVLGSPTGTTPKDPPASTYHYSSCPTVAINKDAEFLLVEREDEQDIPDPLLATAPVITAQAVQKLIQGVIGKFTGAAYHAPSGTWIGSVATPFSDSTNTAGYCRGGGGANGVVGGSSPNHYGTSGGIRSASQSPVAGKKAHKVVAQVDTSDDDVDATVSNPAKGGGGLVRSLSAGRGGGSGTSPSFHGGSGPDAHKGVSSCGVGSGGAFPFLALPSSEVQDWEEPDAGFHLAVTSLFQDVGEFCLNECLSDSQAQQVLLCVDALLQTIMEAHTGSDVIDCDGGGDYHMALVKDVRRCMEECVAAMTLEGEDSESDSNGSRSDRSDEEEDENDEDETAPIGTKEVTIVRRQPTFKTVEERQIRPESLQAWMGRRSAIIDGVSGGGHRSSMSPVLGASTMHHGGVVDGDDPSASIGESAMGASTNLTAADLDPSQLPTLPAPTTYSHLNAAARKALIAHDDTLLQLPAMVVHRRVRLVEEVPQTITIYSNIPWGTAVGFLKLVQRCVLPNLPLFAFCLQPSEVALDALPWLDETLAETEYLPESVYISGMEQVLIAPIVEEVPPGLIPPMGNVHAYALSRAVPGSYVPPCPTASREQALQHLHLLLASLDTTFDDRESIATTIAPAAVSGGRNSARGAKKGGAKGKDTGGGTVLGLAGITLPGGGTLGMGVSETGSTYNLLDGSTCNPFLGYIANAAQQPPSSEVYQPLLPPEEPPLPLDVYTAYQARLSFVADVEGTLSALFQTSWWEPLLSYFTAHFEPVQNEMIAHERQVRAEDRAAALSKKDYMVAAEVAEHRLKRSVVISPQSPLRGAAGHGATSDATHPVADLTSESPRQSRGGKGSKKGGQRPSLTSTTKVSLSASQQGNNPATPDSTTSTAPQPAPTTPHVEPSALETFLLETTERLGKIERHVEVLQSPPTSAPPAIGRGGKQPTAPQRAAGGKASAGRR